jgi:hypothetical protein
MHLPIALPPAGAWHRQRARQVAVRLPARAIAVVFAIDLLIAGGRALSRGGRLSRLLHRRRGHLRRAGDQRRPARSRQVPTNDTNSSIHA